MYAYQNSGRLLLLCIRFACITSKSCYQLCTNGPKNDQSNQVSVELLLLLLNQILMAKQQQKKIDDYPSLCM